MKGSDELSIEERRQLRAVSITEGRTEAQIATEYRERLLTALAAVGELMNEARRDHGMIINFQFGPPDSFNRQSLMILEITKKLC